MTPSLPQCLTFSRALGPVSHFNRKTDNVPRQAPLRPDQMKHNIRADKDGPLFCPAVFNGTRGNVGFQTASAICLDFDKGQPDPSSILAAFPGVLCWLYSTHSHAQEKPRYRAVMALSRAVDTDEHALIVKAIKSQLPAELLTCLDVSCFERARAHFLPSCTTEQQEHAVSQIQGGIPLDVDTLIQAGREIPSDDEIRQGTTATSTTGTRPGDDFNRKHGIQDVLELLGWQHRRGDYYTKPDSHDTQEHHAKRHGNGLYIYSTAAPVPAGFYDPWRLLVFSRYNGDFSAAAKEYGFRGYGEQQPKEQQTKEPAKRTAPVFVSASTIVDELVKIDWQIQGYIEAATLGQIFGASGSGKTFVVLDFGLSTAAGLSWHGRKVKQGLVIYFCGEGRGGLGRRIRAWKTKHPDADIANFYLSRATVDLSDVDAVTAEIQAIADATGQQPVLIIIDTLARHLPGDENSTKDMSSFVAAVDTIKNSFPGCTALVVHHTGVDREKADRGRGSGVFKAASDFEISCNQGLLTFTKMKDAEAPEPIPFKLVPVEIGIDDEGEPVTSCIVEYGERSHKQQSDALPKSERQALEALVSACIKSRNSNNGQFSCSVSSWRDEFYRLRKLEDDTASDDTLTKAFKRASGTGSYSGLKDKGLVAFTENGAVPLRLQEQDRIRDAVTLHSFRKISREVIEPEDAGDRAAWSRSDFDAAEVAV